MKSWTVQHRIYNISPHNVTPRRLSPHSSTLSSSPSPCLNFTRKACFSFQRETFAISAESSENVKLPETKEPPASESTQITKKYKLLTSASPSRYTFSPGQEFEVFTAGAQALVRFGIAAFVSPDLKMFKKRPKEPLVLYEFEGCPFCRKVREAVTLLDLDVIFYPCPQSGPTWRPIAKSLSGKSQFPFLVDPNNGTSMLESNDIINYLWNEYGNGSSNVPFQLTANPLATLTAGIALIPRLGRGSKYTKSKLPDEPLILWAYEASPFCKLVREVLSELEIPHLYKSVARNSPKREELVDKWNVFQVPYIEDPNTGVAMFESKPIIDYINKTYAA